MDVEHRDAAIKKVTVFMNSLLLHLKRLLGGKLASCMAHYCMLDLTGKYPFQELMLAFIYAAVLGAAPFVSRSSEADCRGIHERA